MSRAYEVMIKINGMVDKSLMNAMNRAKDSMKNLGNQKMTANLSNLQAHAKAFKILQDASRQASQQLATNRLNFAQLNSQMKLNQQVAQQISQKYTESKNRTNQIKNERASLKDQKTMLQMQLKTLQDSGVSKESEAYARLQSQLKATNDQIRALGQAYRASSAETKEFSQANKRAQSELRSMEAELARSQEAINRLQSQQANRSQQMEQHRRAINESGYSRNTEEAIRRIERDNARRQAFESSRMNLSTRSQNLQNSLGNFDQAVSIMDTVLSPFNRSLDEAADLEKMTSKVQAIMGGGESVDMTAISKMAKKLGMETNFTSSEAMSAAYYAAIAGWKEQQIIAAMPTALNLANAGDIGIDKAMDIVSDEMTAFGLDTSDSSVIKKFADAFAFTISNANTDAEQLHEAMKYAAPAMHAAGVNAEQTFSMAAMMANAGIKGSSAGTAMRKWALNTIDPGQVSEDLLSAEGMTMSDLSKQQLEAQQALASLFSEEQVQSFYDSERGMINLLQAFAKAGEGKSNADRAAMLRPITGLTAFSGMESVIEAAINGEMGDSSALEKFFQGITTQENTAEKISKVMMENLRGDQALYESAVSAVMTNIGEAILPSMRELLKTVSPIIAKFAEWIEQNSETVKTLAMIAAGISGLIVAGAGLAVLGNLFAFSATGIQTMISGLRRILMMFGMINLSMLPIIAGLALLAGAAYVIISNWSTISPFLTTIFDGLKEKLIASFAIISEQFEHIGNLFSRIGDSSGFETFSAAVIAVFTGIVSFIAGSIASIVSMIANLFASLENIVAGIGDFFNSLMNLDFSGMIDAGKRIGMGILEGLKAVFIDGIGGIISSAIDSVSFGSTVFDRVTSMWNAPQVESTAQGMRAVNEVQHGGGGGGFDTSAVESLNIAVESSSANLQILDSATQTTATNMQLFDSSTQMTGTAMQIFGQSTQFSADNLKNLDLSTQTTATNMQLFDSSTQMTGTAMQIFGQSTQFSADNLKNLDLSTQTTATNMQLFDSSTQMTSMNMQILDQATQLTSTNLNLLDASSQQTSASVMQMGGSFDAITSALSSKAAEISSIQISAPTISIPAGGVPVAHNALGGIYPRGEFLTTFAENSAEAAIPLDGSQRAQSLWIQAGQILGMFPDQDSTAPTNSVNPLQPINPITQSTSTISNSNPVFNLSINVTGNSDQSMVEQIGTSMRESFEDMWRNFQYERERVAFN